MSLRRSLLILPAVLFAPVARASVQVGVGLDVSRDLADGVFSTKAVGAESPERAAFGFGPGLRVPVRIGLGPQGQGALSQTVALRVAPQISLASGWDTVTWSEYEGAVTYYSQDHSTTRLNGALLLGPELFLGAAKGARFQPYAGADVGGVWVRNTYTFSGAAAEDLLGIPADSVSGSSVRPVSTSLAPAAGAHVGLRWTPSGSFAMEVEAGYNVSFLKEAALDQTQDKAVRSAYGLNAVRLGLAASFALGHGTDR